MKIDEVIHIKHFVPKNNCNYLSSWIEQEFTSGNMIESHTGCYQGGYSFYDPTITQWLAGKGRITKKLCNIPEEFFNLYEDVKTALGFNPLNNDVPSLCILIQPGCRIKPHKDMRFACSQHVRCNILLKQPIDGGHPIVSNQIYEMQVGDLVCYAADHHIHACTEVLGNINRVTISYGFVLPYEFQLY